MFTQVHCTEHISYAKIISSFKGILNGHTNMFRKLIANLSFSPSLISEIGFFAHQLKREERIRLFGVIFTILALTVQLLAVLSPPESTNTANANDTIYGGIANRDDLLAKYDNNEQGVQDILSTLGISRAELQNTRYKDYTPATSHYLSGRSNLFEHSKQQHYLVVTRDSGSNATIYFAPATSTLQPSMPRSILAGESDSLGAFAIDTASGNILLTQLPPLTPGQQCANHQESPVTDPQSCVALTHSAHVKNISQATGTSAAATDRLRYTVRTKNTSQIPIDTNFSSSLSDILEYADVIASNGATVDLASKTISWATTTINPGEASTRSFDIRLKSSLPATATGVSNPLSYDCHLTFTYGSRLDTPLACPLAKNIESAASQLPTVPATASIVLGTVVLCVVLYFYIRARQQREEIRLIRKDINNTGGIH